jgi:hypothetical protein
VLTVLVLGHRRHAAIAVRVRVIAVLSKKCAWYSVTVVLPATDGDRRCGPPPVSLAGGGLFITR